METSRRKIVRSFNNLGDGGWHFRPDVVGVVAIDVLMRGDGAWIPVETGITIGLG